VIAEVEYAHRAPHRGQPGLGIVDGHRGIVDSLA